MNALNSQTLDPAQAMKLLRSGLSGPNSILLAPGSSPVTGWTTTIASTFTSYDSAGAAGQVPAEIARLLSAELGTAIQSGPNTPRFEAMQQNVPTFDQSDFIDRAMQIITAIRDAERTGQWDMVRAFMSDRFFRRWQPWAQANLARAAGVGSRSSSLTIASIQSTPLVDQVVVRNLETFPGTHNASVTTRWTMLRSAGHSGEGTTSVVSVCTNCGAPIDASTHTSCRYCGAGVAVLGAMWIVDDIAPEAAAAA